MKLLSLGGVNFIIDTRAGKDRAQSEDNRFVMVKSDEIISYYDEIRRSAPKTIMEIGVFEGGSLVYLDKLFQPTKIVGIDCRKTPIPALDHYIESNPQMRMYYARYQEQRGTLMAARESFPHGIDLVIDDASHLYEQSRATFEMIFPLVKVGGEYIIEDWAWSHRRNNQSPSAAWFNKTSLTRLVFELTILSAVTTAVSAIVVRSGFVSVRRGPGGLPRNAFDLEPHLRGRVLSSI